MTPVLSSRTMDLFADMLRSQRAIADFVRPAVGAKSSWAYPPANWYQSEDAYVMYLEMPGVDPSTLDVQTTRNEITIAGERKAPNVPEGVSFHRRERVFGRFRRTYVLPDLVDSDNVEAKYRNGMLELRVPKAPEARPRRIHLETA